MGTNSQKLNWLYSMKSNIVNQLKQKFAAKNLSYPYTADSNLSSIISHFNSNFWRMKYVPIMTQYVSYQYGTFEGTLAYWNNLRYYNSAYSWLRELSTTNCQYDGHYGYNAPAKFTRNDKGVITGSVYRHPNAVYNLPFVIGMGNFDGSNNAEGWKNGLMYASLTYHYPSSNSLKIVIADDASRNDGQIIVGNISLVDPLVLGTSAINRALLCVSHRYINTGYKNGYVNTSVGHGVTPSVQRENTGRYLLTYNGIGMNTHKYFWPVPSPALSSSAGAEGKCYASIKGIWVEHTKVTLRITTGDDESRNDACVLMILFAQKYE